MLQRLRGGVPSAGVWLGPLAWAISTQTNYALVPWVCVSAAPAVPLVGIGCVLLSLIGFALSLVAWRSRQAASAPDSPLSGAPHRLLALMGTGMGALFAVVIVMQALASLFLTGCE